MRALLARKQAPQAQPTATEEPASQLERDLLRQAQAQGRDTEATRALIGRVTGKLSKRLSRRLTVHLAKVGPEIGLSGLDGGRSASSVSKDSVEVRHAERLADPSRGPVLRRMNFQVIEEPSSDSGEEIEESDASESDSELAELLDDLDIPALAASA